LLDGLSPKEPKEGGQGSAPRKYPAELLERTVRQGPCRGVDDLELATLNWVSWFNETRIHSELSCVTPIEFEQPYYRQINAQQ
jgi:transposase InsO family protein